MIKEMNYKLYDKDTKMPFGRYKGKTFGEVVNEDVKYIIWFIKEIDNVVSENYYFKELGDIMEKRKKDLFPKIEEDTFVYTEDILDDILADKSYKGNNYEERPYYHWRDEDIWAEIAGTGDPDDINDAYWNLD